MPTTAWADGVKNIVRSLFLNVTANDCSFCTLEKHLDTVEKFFEKFGFLGKWIF